MLKANSKIKFQGRVWCPGQEIFGVERDTALMWLRTGQAVGTLDKPDQKPEPEPETETETEPTDWNTMTVPELKAKAAEAGLEVRKNATKAELIRILEGEPT